MVDSLPAFLVEPTLDHQREAVPGVDEVIGEGGITGGTRNDDDHGNGHQDAQQGPQPGQSAGGSHGVETGDDIGINQLCAHFGAGEQ